MAVNSVEDLIPKQEGGCETGYVIGGFYHNEILDSKGRPTGLRIGGWHGNQIFMETEKGINDTGYMIGGRGDIADPKRNYYTGLVISKDERNILYLSSRKKLN